MNLSSTASLSVNDFLAWWVGELRTIFQPVGHLLRHGQSQFVITQQEDEWQLWAVKGRRTRELGRFDVASGMAQLDAPLRNQFKFLKSRRPALSLVLPEKLALQKAIEFPLVPERDLRQALSFEIDRQSPFKAEDVLFDYQVRYRDTATKKLVLELTIVPKQRAESLLNGFREMGLQVTKLDVASGQGNARGIGLNLMNGFASESTRRRMPMLLAAASVLLFVAIVYIPIYQLSTLESSLEKEIQLARKAANDTITMQNDLEQEIRSAEFLDARKTVTPSSIVVLDELTRALPDDTWLQRFQHDQEHASISGYSTGASKLISIIDEQENFINPTFTSPIVKDKNRDIEKFEMKFEIRSQDGKS